LDTSIPFLEICSSYLDSNEGKDHHVFSALPEKGDVSPSDHQHTPTDPIRIHLDAMHIKPRALKAL
jgi:hypothetical protein